MQSGKPVGIFRTHEEAPRVLDEWLYQITANSCLMTIKSGEIIHQAP